ncbi:MAG TPA: hypothetical protein VGW78_03775 [Candidatus Babeliales bacterium]|jgi:hypothetical protein|nr:hypothetical protein [Candidatus Babeliales bacterium]
MYRLDIFFYILTIHIPIIHACPTCIGLPKPGTRPYFEQHGINHHGQTIFLHKNLQNNSSQALSIIHKQSSALPTYIPKPTH